MQVARKRLFSGKDRNYVQLKYIESTGTQYLDTRIVPNFNDIRITAGIQNKSNGGYCVLFGCGDYYPRFYLRFASGTSYLEFNQNSGTEVGSAYRFSNAFKTESISEFYAERGKAVIDGTTYSITDYGDLTSIPDTYSIYIFASNNGGSPFRNTQLKISKFRISDSTQDLIDLIPVKDPEGSVCMYDKVSQTFFYNQGTGDFIAGPEM